MNYRKKPVVIQAMLLKEDKESIAQVIEWVNGIDMSTSVIGRDVCINNVLGSGGINIRTLEGIMLASFGDYIIKGVKGEFYPCKADIFMKSYDPAISGMSFGAAIEALKDGKKVAREGWNGKGMWVVLMPSLKLPAHSTQEPGAKVNDRTAKHIGVDTPLDSQPYIAMWTAAQQWQPGWLASQADILAEDWQVVE